MTFLLFWIGFAVVVGVAANNRGRNGVGWSALAVVISPLLAGLLLLAMPKLLGNDPAKDIATLAMIEATPLGSRSRQLFAESEAKLVAKLEAKQREAAKLAAWQAGSKQRARVALFWIVVAGLVIIIGQQLAVILGHA